jgi:hypothetical protein
MNTAPKPGILALWSLPRARSTVFYRVMLERGDLLALHEPFCNVADYGETDVDGEVVRSANELIGAMRHHATDKLVFFKDTTDHRYPEMLVDREFLRQARHTFLIRRPDEVAVSFLAIKPDMVVEEVGLELMHEIYCAVRDLTGEPPLVVDSDDLVTAPAQTIAAYCAAVGLTFLEEALRWQPSARPEWRRTDRWHQGVNSSTGIVAQRSEHSAEVVHDPRVRRFAEHHEPFYRELYARRLEVSV